MGEILSSKVSEDGRIHFTISLNPDEALQLQGHVNNIFMLSEKTAALKTNIASRGKNEATKYFLIPKEFRKNMSFPKEVACQRIDTKTKTIFVYLIDKIRI